MFSPNAHPGDRHRPGGSLQALRVAQQTPGRHLHLIHPGGGHSTVYRPLAAGLPATWTVTAADDVGHGDTVEALAARYLRDLISAAGVPDLLGGWSLGGLIAFQMARLLQAGGLQPPGLLLLDTPAPGSSGPMPGLAELVQEFAGMLWTGLGLPHEQFPAELTGGSLIADADADADAETALRQLAVALRIAGEPVELELLREQFDVYCRHRRALVGYAPNRGVGAAAVIVTTATDGTASAWRRLLAQPPLVVQLPGGHYDILGAENLPELTRLITGLVE